MTQTKEKQVAILLALYVNRGKMSASSALNFIESERLLLPAEGDEKQVSTGESAFRNSLRWERNRLREIGEIDGSHPGSWIITAKGRERIERISRAVHAKGISEDSNLKLHGLERYAPRMIRLLRSIGSQEIVESLDRVSRA